ncbi:hypothetical protein KSP39_PZI024424 [Platanthera zijinensis]|uniref:DUF641 domain-containing protein n=1 Tax=Platanthera zijinensis TaxID=2320716 RepID=A0AAP0FTU0_9ASPA
MDSTRSSPAPDPPPLGIGIIAKTLTKLLHLRRKPSCSADAVLYRPNPSENLDDLSDYYHKDMEALVANLFVSLSAFKAAYAQLQLAQAPYDADAIQSADLVIVTELRRLSELKQSFFSRAEFKQISTGAQVEMAARFQEQRNLIKTYKITAAKRESELQSKDSEIFFLQTKHRLAEKQCRVLEAQLRPGRTLAGLDELHLSGVNPTHFLALLRSTVKSIRSFVKIMVHGMKSAGWDLDAAAGAIQHDLRRRHNPNLNNLAFQSYVSRKMFSDFQQQDFGLGGPVPDRQQFFADFTEFKFLGQRECFERKLQFGEFCRGKYLGLVHPKMEAIFSGDLQQRELVRSGGGFPETNFCRSFAEMARRVWLLHCLFFTFRPEEKGVIFEARRGSRFSEVYMESVAEEEEEEREGGGDRSPTVGFTVLPGFRVGMTVIQCRVYLVNCSE